MSATFPAPVQCNLTTGTPAEGHRTQPVGSKRSWVARAGVIDLRALRAKGETSIWAHATDLGTNIYESL
jgi:hypothetical protein